jgi:putative addiction module CopG family antidote
MTIKLPPELEQYVREKIASGQFSDESHIITLALHYLKSSDDLFPDSEELRKLVAVGLDEADRGISEPWDPDEIKAEGRRLLAESQQKQKQPQR